MFPSFTGNVSKGGAMVFNCRNNKNQKSVMGIYGMDREFAISGPEHGIVFVLEGILKWVNDLLLNVHNTCFCNNITNLV